MKKLLLVKSLNIILTVVLLLTSASFVLAHPSSQDGILEKTYHKVGYQGSTPAYDYCIGGEDVGWCIYEKRHMNGTYMTYSFDEGNAFLIDSI